MIKKDIPKDWLICKDRDEWHNWLLINHEMETEVWLQIKKVKSKDKGVRLNEAVEEAICFGWIDGLMHSIDTDRFILRFTPRRPGSVWSLINRNRAEKLIAEGKMTEAGMVPIREAMENGKWQTAYTSRKNLEKSQLIAWLKEKQDLRKYVDIVSKEASLVPQLLDIIETDKSAVKFQAEKIIRMISEERPIIIYPYFERIAALLYCGNNFIKWGAIQMIPNLLDVDKEHLWTKVRERYMETYMSPQIVEFGNGVKGAEKILAAYPEEEPILIPPLLSIDEHIFLYKGEVSKECQNVAIGQIIETFEKIYPKSSYKKEMILFAENNIYNERKTVKAKALRFLRKYSKEQN